MIEGKKYIEIVKQFYSFLETEFGFKKENETINGNVLYDVEFKNKETVVSISYENIEDHLDVIVFILQDGEMPDYDNKIKTLHLKQLNKFIMKRINKNDIRLNTEYFTKYNAKNEIEQRILKGAKELRLYLKYS
jgi:hypothetical protein